MRTNSRGSASPTRIASAGSRACPPHISIEYGIKYDGIDIRKLSPGTRGIVLVLLYLALDDDDRPLIID
jgi:hypothetical protein